jgi:glyoxylase-like metal-dependent hydrolase (beta-lactamase superfamily II)
MNVTIIPVGMIGTNCYLLAAGDNSCAIIDPGANPGKIAEIIREKGYNPKHILLTHGHWDHTGAVKGLLLEFPGLDFYIGEKDLELLEDAEKSRALFRGFSAEEYNIAGAKTLGEGDTVELADLTIKVIETPGHTFGGVCYICGDIIFSGDTLFYENIGRCDLYGGDIKVIKQSLKKLAALPGDYVVYPGHVESTTLEHERANNPYMR